MLLVGFQRVWGLRMLPCMSIQFPARTKDIFDSFSSLTDIQEKLGFPTQMVLEISCFSAS